MSQSSTISLLRSVCELSNFFLSFYATPCKLWYVINTYQKFPQSHYSRVHTVCLSGNWSMTSVTSVLQAYYAILPCRLLLIPLPQRSFQFLRGHDYMCLSMVGTVLLSFSFLLPQLDPRSTGVSEVLSHSYALHDPTSVEGSSSVGWMHVAAWSLP